MIGPRSYMLRTVARLAFFLINAFALVLLWRGHNLPGGGFIAGLATSISLILLSLAIGLEELHRLMRFDPVRLAAGGLLLAVLTGAVPLVLGRPFLEQFNWHIGVPLVGELHLGTPLVFDLGVYCVVVGVACKVIFILGKSTQGLRALVQEEERRYSSVVEQPIEEEAVLETETSGEELQHAD